MFCSLTLFEGRNVRTKIEFHFKGDFMLSRYRFVFRSYALLHLLFALGCSLWGDGDRLEDVNLEKAVWLRAEKVPLAVDNGGVPGITPSVPVNNLFKLTPGTKVNASALGGVIDPTGTTIANDFDGDGILNTDETTTNVWVADYPVIEAIVAPPITMKIEILKNSSNTSDEITSEINSSDFESTKTKGSESIHQNEVNLKTVQFQDSFASSNELSQSVSNSLSYGTATKIGPVQLGFNYASSSSNSWEAKNSLSTTTTKWADKPFKNNIDTQSNNLKSSSASTKAKKFRSEKSQKINETSKVDANAGYVRAALYIKNASVNMPVKLKNILCSLMFESGTGDLIPVQSFRLRNDDYSLFEVSVYGGSEFGPYVVELTGLNTVEIENAIAAGYNPKIFIVDYEMSHVPDSNYKSSLLNFSGDNLKIIEENSKGRTGLVRIYGPNIRQMYRVAAFDAPENSDVCARTANVLSPGITLRKVLERLQCNGLKVEFQDYVVNLAEIAPTLGEYKIHLKGIKTLGPVPTNIPCVDETHTGSDGQSRTACVQKPLSTWTDEEKKNAGVWAIYSNGKYYNLTEYFKDLDDSIRTFDPTNSQKVPMVKGVDSIIWAGDYYDIVYISYKDLLKKEEEQTFGTNPLETQREYTINTSWDLNSLGEYPYNPNVKSLFLGKVGFGEKVELNIKLDRTTYLTPNFGTPTVLNGFQYFANFSYNIIDSTKSFSIDQVVDLELSMGFGGDRSDWFHVVKDLDNNDDYKLKSCGRTLDFVSQTFSLCVELPTRHAYVDPEVSLISLYLRPSLSNAYRRTIWPLAYADVRKMRGELQEALAVGDTVIHVANPSGLAEVSDKVYILGDPNQYTISTISSPASDGSYSLTISPAIKKIGKKTTEVYVKGTLTSSDVRLAVDNNFVNDWNAQVNLSFLPTEWNLNQFLPFVSSSGASCSGVDAFHPLSCLGFKANLDAINWSGAYNRGVALWNSWADATGFSNFLSNGLFGLTSNTGSSYKLEPSKTDFIVSANVGVTYALAPKIVSYGDTALIVHLRASSSTGWTDANLYGRYYQLSTGIPLTGEFKINPVNSTGNSISGVLNFNVGIKNNKAVVTWEIYPVETSETMHRFAVLDLTALSTTISGAFDGPFFQNGPAVDLYIGDNTALFTWNELITTGSSSSTNRTNRITGVLYNISTGAVVKSNFSILSSLINTGTTAYTYNTAYRGWKENNKVTFVLQTDRNTPTDTYDLKMASVDLATGTVSNDSLFNLGSSGSLATTGLSISTSGNYTLISWKLPTNEAKAVVIDTVGQVVNAVQSVDTNTTEILTYSSGNAGYIEYGKDNRIYLRAINLQTGSFLDTVGLAIDTIVTSATKIPRKLSLFGSTLVSLWEHTQNSRTTVRGRYVNIAGTPALKGPGEFFVSTTSLGNHTTPDIAGSTQFGLVAWTATGDFLVPPSRIRAIGLDFSSPGGALQYGMNNFFIAPLIEREFTIWTKISN